MNVGLLSRWLVLLLLALNGSARGHEAAPNSRPRDYAAVDFQRRTIYHSPQQPGYTCWVFAWLMPDDSIMVSFYQATGPIEGRPRAPEDIQKKLSWPHLADPRRDQTGLQSSNVFLRSKDGGATWEKVSEDFFDTPINGAVNGIVGLRSGSILRAVFGAYLAYEPDVQRTGLVQRSADGSKTWDKPACCLPPAEYTVRPAGLRQLRDGRVVMLGGVSRGPAGRAWEDYTEAMEPLLLVSQDEGKTWGAPIPVIPVENRAGWACEECDAVELPNGDLFWVFRRCAPEDVGRPLFQRRHVQWQGLTEKRGDTWAPKWVQPTPFGNTGLPNLLVTREGVVLHSKIGQWTSDQGKSWQRLNLPDMGYYPKAVQLRDGRILVFAHVGSDDPYGAVDQSIIVNEFRLDAR